MNQPLFQKQLADHMRKLTQLYQDVENRKISESEALERLDVLKAEQQRLNEAGNVQVSKGGNMIRRYSRIRKRASSPEHGLDFKCQCARCVRMHTITLADRDLLREMKITWGKIAAEEVGAEPAKGIQNI